MPKYKLKQAELVDAIPAKTAINAAKSDWSALPAWVKVGYQKGKILFGAEKIHINDRYLNEEAGINDVIVCGSDGVITAMPQKEFIERYELVNS